MTDQPQQVFYGRRKGRSLRLLKTHLMETLLPRVEISEDTSPLSPPTLFSKSTHNLSNYWLEIGFGGGEHLATLAQNHPHIGFIGAEAFINGVASLLEHIHNHHLENIRIYPKPVQNLISRLASQSIQKVFIMFPDPWPKARHHKRRLVNMNFLKEIARILSSEGTLHFASDDQDYVDAVRELLQDNSFFTLQKHDQVRPSDWPPTRYEEKALAQGKCCHYLCIKRSSVYQ